MIKPATQLYPHNLSSILESAIRATNAQFEDADILNRLDVRLLEQSPGDTGWDVFSLDYHVDGPIGTVSLHVFFICGLNQYVSLACLNKESVLFAILDLRTKLYSIFNTLQCFMES